MMDMNCKHDTNFAVRAYGKSELALLYFPDASSGHIALNHLMAWITRCKELRSKLEAGGYVKTAKYFTPKEVAMITDYLGEP
ncbi:DUF4248 domain-containing protein [Segatella bryantii]|uniref:DUF4248 domain-containing protein n=1 Tax=Segatella bryantii TaxID=77095 RepID=UPI001EDB03EA|nr:DUF4248 domain-containing protein [Segatella bryantii]UKK75755.1 DUF4248 domain-containing protein [Segatella bryantii]